MDYEFLADLNVDYLVRQKLSLILNNVVSGSEQVLLTPLGKSYAPDLILREFDAIFNKPSNRKLINAELLKSELQNRDKFGPRSVMLPWILRRDSVLEYFEAEVKGPDLITTPPISKDLFKLRPISLEVASRFLKNSTSSGFPFITRKGEVKEWYNVNYSKDLLTEWPAVIYTRTQEGNKTRNIWGVCMSLILAETRFYRPLLDYQKKQSWRSALIGPDEVDSKVTELVNSAMLRNVSLLSIDFSRYDATVKSRLQRYAFDYIKALFQKSYHEEIDYLYHRFNTMPLITPEGIMKGSHGVPSGSTFTNEVDSIVQYLISVNSKYIFKENIQIQGDDGVCAIPKDNIERVFKSYTDHGLIVNEDKSKVSQNSCTYLQKYYCSDYRGSDGIIGGIYPVYRALIRLVYQERWTNFEDFGILGKDYYSIRAITILENCKHHPLFTELVKFVISLDKYNLKYSQDGLNKYVSMLIETTGSEGILINQYGDNVRGISSFETVKLIKSLA